MKEEEEEKKPTEFLLVREAGSLSRKMNTGEIQAVNINFALSCVNIFPQRFTAANSWTLNTSP